MLNHHPLTTIIRNCLVLAVTFSLTVFCRTVPLEAQQPREPWTTSRIKGSPEPPLPYTVERILPAIEFHNPVDFAVEPGTGRWFVLQLDGKLFAFDPRNNEAPELVHDAHATIEDHRQSYGIEFHPDYLENREIFLSYVIPNDLPDGTHVSRFQVLPGPTPKIDPSSEELIITWYSGGHNGACMKFGPDGMLYITAGDGTGPFPPDSADVGQDLSDLRSTIMRINVDEVGIDRAYTIPKDNPFLDLPNARPEVWSFGFRNPWKISFDEKTGELWCGDVGWELWELLFRVERGGNYGWSIKEGQQTVRTDIKQGPGEIQPPIVEHLHTEARSITGGFVYYGSKLKELSGTYVYGDYVTGKIWGLVNEGDQVGILNELADTSLAIITFGLDADKELVILDYAGGMYRLVRNPVTDTSSDFPRRLSQTGLFEELSPAILNAKGVYDYSLISKMWQDGAESKTQIALPETSSVVWKANHEHWEYPQDTVFVKTIFSQQPEGRHSGIPVETQILHFDGFQWNPYSYLWNETLTDAELVPQEGFSIDRPAQTSTDKESTSQSKLTWRVHSRPECSSCHVPRAGHAIGFDLPNLNLETESGLNQLDEMVRLGLFDRKIPKQHTTARMIAVDETGDLETRARSYLAINCAHCHRRGGGGTAHIEFPFTHALDQTNSVGERPTQGTFAIGGAEIISPGDPLRSVLYYRMATVGRGHMPRLGSHDIDEAGLALIREWISSLSDNCETPLNRIKINQAVLTALANLEKSGTVDAQNARVGQFGGRGSSSLYTRLEQVEDSQRQREKLRVCLSRYRPPIHADYSSGFFRGQERVPTLGDTVDPDSILALSGDD